jgi:hypothetical protein
VAFYGPGDVEVTFKLTPKQVAEVDGEIFNITSGAPTEGIQEEWEAIRLAFKAGSTTFTRRQVRLVRDFAYHELDLLQDQGHGGSGVDPENRNAVGLWKRIYANANTVLEATKPPPTMPPPEMFPLANPMTAAERLAVSRTARKLGAVGAKAIVPRFVQAILGIRIPHSATALDFGAGPAEHTARLRTFGLSVTAHDVPTEYNKKWWHLYDPTALERQYDLVYASNVLNTLPSAGVLEEVVRTIAQATKPDGVAVMNYPEDPRKVRGGDGRILTPDEVERVIRLYFGDVMTATTRGFGTKRTPVFVAEKPG